MASFLELEHQGVDIRGGVRRGGAVVVDYEDMHVDVVLDRYAKVRRCGWEEDETNVSMRESSLVKRLYVSRRKNLGIVQVSLRK